MMKRRVTAAALFLACAATTVSANPIEGVWQTQPDEGAFAHVKIVPCGAGFCGKIARTFRGSAEYKAETIGLQIVTDMVPQSAGNYTGKVLRPADRKVYNGKVNLSGNEMKLSGCVAGGLICRSQTWVRIQ